MWRCGGGVKSTSENSMGDRMKLLEITHYIQGRWKKKRFTGSKEMAGKKEIQYN